MADRGVDSMFIGSSNDGGLDMLAKHFGGGAHKPQGRPNLSLTLVQDAHPTITPRRPQHGPPALTATFPTPASPRPSL